MVRRYLLHIAEDSPRTYVALGHRTIELGLPKGSDTAKKRKVMDSWYREELRKAAKPRVQWWEGQLGLEVRRFFVQKMKTKWGSSNPRSSTIRLNLELAKKPCECLDCVVLHEMARFIVPHHGEQFTALLDAYMPNWRHVRKHLNELPLPPA